MITGNIRDLEARKVHAADVLNYCGFDMVHLNGQRISTNRHLCEDKISQYENTEIFIGKLPRDLFEDELLYHLVQVGGSIYKIRYMMDFSGSNRGFCFVKFARPEEARMACDALDGKYLRPNTAPIGVKMSLDNKVLFVGKLPPKCTAQQLLNALKKVEIGGIVGACMANGPMSGGRYYQARHPVGVYGGDYFRSRPACSYGYVYFESHDAATKARRLLMPSDIKIMGRKITIDWAKSEMPTEIRNNDRWNSNRSSPSY